MPTQFIGVKEFRQNMAFFTKKAQEKRVRIIVLKKNKPLFEIKPIDEKEIALAKEKAEIKEAREQIKRGEFYTNEEIMREFGSKK